MSWSDWARAERKREDREAMLKIGCLGAMLVGVLAAKLAAVAAVVYVAVLALRAAGVDL